MRNNRCTNVFTHEDNRDTLRHFVIGSFDPNDKQVTPVGNLAPQLVPSSPWLTYKVRFQNTGNDTAFTVRIEDVIDGGLELASLEVLSASHEYSWEIGENRTVNWTFNNILLPDSNVDEPGSHGFVKYRIRTKPNLVDLPIRLVFILILMRLLSPIRW